MRKIRTHIFGILAMLFCACLLLAHVRSAEAKSRPGAAQRIRGAEEIYGDAAEEDLPEEESTEEDTTEEETTEEETTEEETTEEESTEQEFEEGWVLLEDGWYYGNGDGSFYEGWLYDDGFWFYLGEDGRMVTGWAEISGKRYLFTGGGRMRTGWAKDGECWYYLNPGGSMRTGWLSDNGKWYYLGEDGVMQTGWAEISGKQYYLKSSGAMAVGWTLIEEQWYYFRDSGLIQTGWVYVKNGWYYLNEEGQMQTGWLAQGSALYYLRESGRAAEGWLKIDGVWYHFRNASCKMDRGWLRDEGTWYYLNEEGRMQTGWLTLQDKTYYLDKSGAMATGAAMVDHSLYEFGAASGVLVSGFVYQEDRTWRYLTPEGELDTKHVIRYLKLYPGEAGLPEQIFAKDDKNGNARTPDLEKAFGAANPGRRVNDSAAAARMIAQARAWVGCKKLDDTHKYIIDLYNTQNPLPYRYKMGYTDSWCAAFVTACAMESGCASVIPGECGVERMIVLMQNLGMWIEDDSYVPRPGDLIVYSWSETGMKNNDNFARHIGIVEYCDGELIVAIEGNRDNDVGRRIIPVDGKYIRGFGVPDYAKLDNPAGGE